MTTGPTGTLLYFFKSENCCLLRIAYILVS